MARIRNWLQKLRRGVTRFMAGRYGMDKLNTLLLWISVVVVFLALFIPFPLVRLGVTALSYLIMGVAVWRVLSRKTYQRYRENRRYLMLLDRLRDREHRYFECPRCHQPVRVPRGKGKIWITCPKCKEKFMKKT